MEESDGGELEDSLLMDSSVQERCDTRATVEGTVRGGGVDSDSCSVCCKSFHCC